MKKHVIIIIFLIISFNIYALVDYTDDGDAPSISSPAKRTIKVNKRSVGRVSRRSGGKNNLISRVSFDSSIDIMKINYDARESKINKYDLNLFIQSGYNFFISADYYYVSTDTNKIAPKTTSPQGGNPLLKLGFNWLKFGKSEDLATIDIYGGLMLKESGSDFASSRIDKIAGVETTKRFVDFAIGIGYETRLTGNPSNSFENSVGNINKLSFALGWRVSSDINISVEGVTTKISKADNAPENSVLSSGFSFGYVSPKLSLKIGKYIGIDLESVFRTNKADINEDIMNARLWDLKGLHGNSIGAGLRIEL